MGLLADVFSWGDKQKRRVRGLLDNPKDEARVFAHRSAETTRDFLLDPMNFVGGGLGKIAWHGSPHKFDKFDLGKIGTGEGAQAYGHGAYLAESPAVAQEYKSALSNPEIAFPDGRVIASTKAGSAEDQAKAWLEDAFASQSGSPYQHAANRIRQEMKYAKNPKDYQDALDVLGKWEAEGGQVGFGGHLYKTDIPDEAVARFLDWDKPLSQQAPEVQKAIKGMRDKFPRGSDGWDIRPWMDADPLASTWHNEAVRNLGVGQDFFTKHLSSGGVPGIRYLDGGSRGAGSGTSNYVIFDPDMIRILERNGVATGAKPWAPGEWGGLLGP